LERSYCFLNTTLEKQEGEEKDEGEVEE
jgi:hypothetical protein